MLMFILLLPLTSGVTLRKVPSSLSYFLLHTPATALFRIRDNVCSASGTVPGLQEEFNKWQLSASVLCPYYLGVLKKSGASLIAQRVKNLPTMQETQVRSLGQEDTPDEEMATQSSIVA